MASLHPLEEFRSLRYTGDARREIRTGQRRRFCVGVNGKPRDYEPNSGPPLPRLRLLPEHDSTAYILERILLPPNEIARDGQLRPKRMTYLVGWRDFPAASLLVPAQNILDYVSPRELETWESAMEEELKLDRQELEAEKAEPTKPPSGKRKRGRPPAHTKIEAAVVAEVETMEDAHEHLTGGALSLTTPQKRRMEALSGISEPEGSPSRQLEGELYDPHILPVSQAEDLEMVEYTDPDAMEIVQDADIYNQSSTATSTSYELTNGFEQLDPLRGTPGQREPFLPANVFATPRDVVAQEKVDFMEEKTPRAPTKDSMTVSEKEAEQEEDEWVVKQVEDDGYHEIEGVGPVRYFKVRWEGDWPPDQNPSWEPEENLPIDLVRHYLKLKKERAKKAREERSQRPQKESKPSMPPKDVEHSMPPLTAAEKFRQTLLPWATSRYSGGQSHGLGGDTVNYGARSESPASQMMGQTANGHGRAPRDRDLDDELLLVEEAAKPTTGASSWTWNIPRGGTY